MAEEKPGLLFIYGNYQGRTKAEKNAEGTKKDGTAWKRYRAQFLCILDNNEQKILNFGMFSGCKGEDLLKEDEWFTLGYSVGEIKLDNGETAKPKTVQIIQTADPEKLKIRMESEVTPPSQGSTPQKALTASNTYDSEQDVKEFIDKYSKLPKENQKGKYHKVYCFLATMLKSHPEVAISKLTWDVLLESEKEKKELEIEE